MKRKRNIGWISFIIAVVLVLSASAATYRRITGMPHAFEDAVDLVLEIAYDHRAEIEEEIAYVEDVQATGRTKVRLYTGLYEDIAPWLVDANAKLSELNAKITPLETMFE
jgi:hypothetical protein